jgi:hypothetical protein
MATKPTYKAEKPSVRSEAKHYVVEREWKKEKAKVMELEKELKAHEKTDLLKAHPLPNMRSE